MVRGFKSLPFLFGNVAEMVEGTRLERERRVTLSRRFESCRFRVAGSGYYSRSSPAI